MKLAIVGYGKMGHMVETLAPSYGFDTIVTIDASDPIGNAAEADAAIEFSTPDAAPENLLQLAELRVPSVCGTTAWFHQLPEIKAAFEAARTPLVYSPNFSIGVNIFFRLAEEASRLTQQYEEYGAWAWELHHAAKKDAPSGTLVLAVERMKAAGFKRHIDVSSNRAGNVPGTHELGFDSPADTITLRHTARSREGFARGALEAARWAVAHSQTKPGAHEFSNILFG